MIRQLSSGGGCVCAFEFAAEANRQGGGSVVHEVLTLERVSRRLYRPPGGVPFYFPRDDDFARLAKRVQARGYDVLHVHWWHRDPLLARFMRETRAIGAPYRVLTCDVFPGSEEFRLEASDINYADQIVFDGLGSLEAYPEIAPAKKSFIVGGTNLDRYRRARRRRRANDGRIRFARGSTLNIEKVPEGLIAMVEPILRATPNAEFHIFGSGPMESALRAEIEARGLRERIALRGWSADFAQEMADVDVYLYHLPENSYASSELNLQGAMAAGVAIAAMPSKGVRWMFRDGEDSLVGDGMEACAQAAIRLARDPDLRARIAAGGRRRAEAEFGVRNMARAYREQIYSRAGAAPTVASPFANAAQALRRAQWRATSAFYLPLPKF